MSFNDHNPSSSGWRFEKRVSFGDLVKTAIAVAAIFLFLKDVEMKVELNSSDITTLQELHREERMERKNVDQRIRMELSRNEDEMRELMSEVRKSLQRIEDKINKKADK